MTETGWVTIEAVCANPDCPGSDASYEAFEVEASEAMKVVESTDYAEEYACPHCGEPADLHVVEG